MFFLITFRYKRYENNNGTVMFASSGRFGTYTFWPWKVNFKIRPQVRSRWDHDPTKSICTSFKATRRAKLFGTICASLSSSCRDSLAKNWWWPHLTSFDLRWPRRDPPIVSCTRIITDGVSAHDPERIGLFQSVYAKRKALTALFSP